MRLWVWQLGCIDSTTVVTQHFVMCWGSAFTVRTCFRFARIYLSACILGIAYVQYESHFHCRAFGHGDSHQTGWRSSEVVRNWSEETYAWIFM